MLSPGRSLGQAGAVDFSFTNGAPALALTRLAVQSDDKILVGGAMTITAQSTISNVVRLEANGAFDPTFPPGPGLLQTDIIPGSFTNVAPGYLAALVVQADGKVLVGGTFNSAGGVAKTNVLRLNTDGSLDRAFEAGVTDGSVLSIRPLSDGRLLIGGGFTKVHGAARPGIALISTNGLLDTSFVPNLGSFFGASVRAIAVQPGDGKILIAGGASRLNPGLTTSPVLRLEVNGTLDASFSPLLLGTYQQAALDMVLQADGRIVISGMFDSVGGVPHVGIACLNSDGTLNTNWPGTGVNALNSAFRNVSTMLAQPDGKIVIGGRFEQYNGVSRIGVARLNVDGSLDSGFTSPATSTFQVGTMVRQSDGQLVLGGVFTFGTTSYSLIRLGTGTAAPTLAFTLLSGSLLHFEVPTGFELQHAPLPTGDWSRVPGNPPFDLPITNASEFFRLISL